VILSVGESLEYTFKYRFARYRRAGDRVGRIKLSAVSTGELEQPALMRSVEKVRKPRCFAVADDTQSPQAVLFRLDGHRDQQRDGTTVTGDPGPREQ
jgi:hypothetical protein